MPFDELKTDEKLTEPQRRLKDFEGQLMVGCGVVVVVSLFTYVLSVWPFFRFPEYEISGLITIAVIGGVPATILGAIAVRRCGVPGTSGFVGGAMASAVFMYLRLRETMLAKLNPDLPQPEYPERWAWMVPLAWVLWTVAVSLILMPPEAIPRENSGSSDRQS